MIFFFSCKAQRCNPVGGYQHSPVTKITDVTQIGKHVGSPHLKRILTRRIGTSESTWRKKKEHWKWESPCNWAEQKAILPRISQTKKKHTKHTLIKLIQDFAIILITFMVAHHLSTTWSITSLIDKWDWSFMDIYNPRIQVWGLAPNFLVCWWSC